MLDKDAESNLVTVGPYDALRVEQVKLRGVRLRRSGSQSRPRQAALPLEAAAGPRRPAHRAPGATRRCRWSSVEPAYGVAPGPDGVPDGRRDVIGWGTITRG